MSPLISAEVPQWWSDHYGLQTDASSSLLKRVSVCLCSLSVCLLCALSSGESLQLEKLLIVLHR